MRHPYYLRCKRSITAAMVAVSCIFLVSCQQDTDTNKADRIYINASVWTANEANPNANAIAVKDSVIVFVGDEYEAYRVDETEIINLQGKMVFPGFIDNHTHFLSGGYQLTSVDLRTASTPEEFINTLRDFAGTNQDGR